MAASRALKSPFINKFVGEAVSFTTGATKSAPTSFTTSRQGADRVSAMVLLETIHYDKANNTIKAFCSDGNLRECRISRLPSVEAGRELWKMLMAAGAAKEEIRFVAAGGFSPDKWFYDVE